MKMFGYELMKSSPVENKMPVIDDQKSTVNISMDDLHRFFDNQTTLYAKSYSKEETLSKYEAASYVGALVDIISTDISKLKYTIKVGKKDVMNDSRVIEITKNRFRTMTKQMIQHLMLDGNAFIVMDQPTIRDVVKNSYLLQIQNPALVQVYSETSQLITDKFNTSLSFVGYYNCFINGSLMRKIPPELMIHAIDIGPHNFLRGMGKIQQNSSVFYVDEVTNLFNASFYANGCKLPFIFFPEDKMGVQEQKSFATQFIDAIKGTKNWFKPLISPVKGSVTQLQQNQNDSQYIEQRKLTKMDIREIFQVPSIVIGGDQARYDSAVEQLEAYYTLALPRYYVSLEEAYSLLFSRILKQDAVFEFIPIKMQRLDKLDGAFDRGAITRNDYRDIFGLPRDEENEEMDDYYMTMQYVPADQINQDIAMPNSEPPEEQLTDNSKPKMPPNKSISVDIKKITRDFQWAIHRRSKKTRVKTEKTIFKSVKSFCDGQQKRVIAKIDSLGRAFNDITEDDIFDPEEERPMAKRAMGAAFMSALALSVMDVNDLLDRNIDSSTRNKSIVLAAEKLGRKYADYTIGTRTDDLRKIVTEWKASSSGLSELSGMVKDYFDRLTGENAWMATRIARTEASNAWSQAAFIGYDEIGVTEYDVIGCEDDEGHCNATGIPASERDAIDFHPNHTGTIVPSM